VRKGPLVALVAALIGVGIALALVRGNAPPSDEQSPGASSNDHLPSAVRILLGSRLDQVTDVGCVEAPRRGSDRYDTVAVTGLLRRLTGLRGTAALVEAPNVRCRIKLANGRKVMFVKVGSQWSRVPPPGVSRSPAVTGPPADEERGLSACSDHPSWRASRGGLVHA
jgi:hypothetical protein